MCSIVGSFNKEKIKELIKINQYRGNFSYSISLIDIDNNNKILQQIKHFGLFDYNLLDNLEVVNKNVYYVCHVQAPTGGLLKEYNRIHPTKVNNSYLWHNGIITPKGMKYLQDYSYNNNIDFDTLALNNQLYNGNFCDLSAIEGLFSCLYLDNNLYMFRTKHGKLYIDTNLNISSEKFNNSKCINFDTVYKVNLKDKNIIIYDTFKTKKFNVIIKGEL